MDMRVIVKRTLFYAVWTLFISMGYAAIVFVMPFIIRGRDFSYLYATFWQTGSIYR